VNPFVPELNTSAHAALAEAVAHTGFAAWGPGALEPALFDSLRAEAEVQRAQAWGRAEGRTVAHSNRRANLGPVALEFLSAPRTLALLAEVAGAALRPSLEASCFTYYDAEDDFLAPHLDRPGACAFTLIVYLAVKWPAGAEPGAGLELRVFAPGDEAGSGAPRAVLPTRENLLVVGRGAQVPHGRSALAAGEQVVALTACYAVAHDGSQDVARAAILADEGFVEYGQGEIDEARSRFQSALALDDRCAAAWNGLGFVEWSAREFAEALAMFRIAASCDGDDASIWSNIGLCLRDLGAFDRAERAFEVALMLDPDYAPAVNEWGNVLQDQGRSDEAVPLYLRALAIDPTRAVVHHNLGVAYGRLGETMLAVQAFTAALERDPAYAHSLEEIGLLCAGGGLVDEARRYLEAAGTERAAAILASLSSDV
jgi:tetratricopeptide (TPR) repeat protein